ncbi:MAG: sulfatase-like hydrolase/transferase [Polyangiaceae bacterium]|nr:sulfatase-like hydrolase/transferase [Polyangiaceae bacterium]
MSDARAAGHGGNWKKRSRFFFFGLFCAQFVILDWVTRRGRLFSNGRSVYEVLLGGVHSVLFWCFFGILLCRWAWGRLFLGLLAGAAFAFQALFFDRFGRYADRFVAKSAFASWDDIAPAFQNELPMLIAAVVLGASIEGLLLQVSRAPRFAPRRAGLAVATLSALIPVFVSSKSPPDLRLFEVVTEIPIGSPEPSAIAATVLPKLRSSREKLPNIVLVVTESVRADSYCSDPSAVCPTAPRVNALMSDRIGLTQMRSLASFTAISMSVLMTGRIQNIPKEELLSSPTLFDIAKSLDAADRPYTAYWSAHHAPVFHWDNPKRSLDSYVTFDTLFEQEGSSSLADRRLAEMFEARLPKLKEPFLVVLHFHDTHILYGFDESAAPFTPWTRTVTWETLPGLKNAYKNAIFFQDESIAKALLALKNDPRWENTFLVFTSDHGEGFGEHHSIHHGQNVLDEQIHVPAFIAHGKNVATEAEKAAIVANSQKNLTHLDVLPTLLDVYGIWGAPELVLHSKKMDGRSLLKPIQNKSAPVPLTNCTEAFPCPFNNWGMLGDGTKIEAQAWDGGWHCKKWNNESEFDVPVGDAECRALEKASRGHFAELPSGSPNE